MSRLLQALKNLEARSPKSAAGKGLLGHLAEKYRSPSPDPPLKPPAEPTRPSKPTPIEPRPADNPLAYLSMGVPTILLDPPPAAAAPFPPADAFAPVYVNELVPSPVPVPDERVPDESVGSPWRESSLPLEEVSLSKTPDPYDIAPPIEPIPVEGASNFPVESPAAALARQATLLERTVRRTLADPARSEPFRQLAERLWNDLDATSGRTILLTGVGPASDTHDVILHAAAILAQRGQPIAVVDADAAHRSLTCQLDFPDGKGLAELVQNDRNPAVLLRPTTFDLLSVLPFGQARLGDPAAAANRLAAILQTLEADHRLVLIDGGRSSELAAATLARLADATYFVVRLGETEAAQAQSALRDFRAAGARVLGCIATSS
jgi:Mrp family chromosome partitioning ATPase